MRRTTVVIIGAGQTGLAMSRHLGWRGIDHVLLERGEVANSWRTERWDSLRLLTPTWQSRLPGLDTTGPDPDGFRTMPETVEFLARYAAAIAAPVETQTRVLNVTLEGAGYRVDTDRGVWMCRSVVIASGACNIASVPRAAASLSPRIQSITPMAYRNPESVDMGGVLVVGASASGVQIARELQRSGRPVTLAVGEHVRAPRTYRNRDIKWWMDASGLLSTGLDTIDDVRRARDVPSMQLIGSPERDSIDLNSLQDEGVRITGRLAGLDGAKAQFSGSVANVCRLADLKLNRMLATIDGWASRNGHDGGDIWRPLPTRIPDAPALTLDLWDAGIRTVLWATGYRPDYSWLGVPVLDHKGGMRHAGGVTEAPGLYVLGLPFLRQRKSTLIDGAGEDAGALADHIAAHLAGASAQAA